jgi:hypothetical protein
LKFDCEVKKLCFEVSTGIFNRVAFRIDMQTVLTLFSGEQLKKE